MAAVVLSGMSEIPRGSFSRNLTDRPENLRDTSHDPVESVLKDSWMTGISNGVWPATVNPYDPWGDPRPAGLSAQTVASLLSVGLAQSASSARASANATSSAGGSSVTPISSASAASKTPAPVQSVSSS